MIALDFCRWRAPATESIAVALVEEARARQRQKDKRGCIHWCNVRAKYPVTVFISISSAPVSVRLEQPAAQRADVSGAQQQQDIV
ncbi:MAG: hypothetical protein OXN26_01220, partial [Gammaproteobacteria bacterium]|nr:hypothetical protein [Gammaproteobacteria bacterium]